MCGIFALLCRNMRQKYDFSRIYKSFQRIAHRGPDDHQTMEVNDKLYMGFHRLAINDLSVTGNQPMILDDKYILICNGEIYNFHKLASRYNFKMKSRSDCEVILHMYKKFGIERCVNELDGVFAFTLYDKDKDELYAARDPFGVRPLFIGKDNNSDSILMCSEAKGIIDLASPNTISQFPPGHLWRSSNPNHFCKWFYLEDDVLPEYNTEEDALKIIYKTFTKAVEKRIMSDRPIGAFLSGGLDSSLVAALIHEQTPINTYAIGMKGATDLEKAEIAAKYLNTNHTNVEFTEEEGISAIEDLVCQLETYDITTIRASVGMYLLSKYIKQNTVDTVIYSGEGSDEATQGYLYFHDAPSPFEGHTDSVRLLNNLHFYDNLRCDRSTSKWSLEVRVPFLDKSFVKNFLRISPNIRTPVYKKCEKYLIRKAFDLYKPGILPHEILWRTKEAFSDGVSSIKKPWHETLKNFINKQISDSEFENALLDDKLYGNNKPISKESLYYRKLYNKHFGEHNLIPYYWLPQWNNATDPSARTINVYEKRIEA